MNQKSHMIIYTTEDGLTKIETTFDEDTVWLSIDQMAELFQRDRSVIGKHVRNIFKEGELIKESVWAKFAYTATDGKVYDVDFYNLDVIIFQSSFLRRFRTKSTMPSIDRLHQKLFIQGLMQKRNLWD